MGTNTLNTKSGGTVVDDDFNQFLTALTNAVVGRNGAGIPTSGRDLGTAAIPWGTVYANTLNIAGQIIDFDNIGVSSTNGVISGKSRTDSDQPSFIAPAGSGGGASLTVEGLTTNLIANINGVGVTVTTDIVEGSLTLAAGANNTALVNDVNLSDQEVTKFLGEEGSTIPIDTAGTEITSRVGQYAAFQKGSEIFLGFIESATEITRCFRGWFIDDADAPLVRETLANNDVLTILSLGWVFLEDNATTVDVSYTTPIWAFTEPGSPATGDYWFDLQNDQWKRFDGSVFQVIDRLLIGKIVINTADAVAARSVDLNKAFDQFIEIDLKLESDTEVKSNTPISILSVYGSLIDFQFQDLTFDTATDFESGVSISANATFYLYISTEGEKFISDEKPYYRNDLRGFYHPYHTWRYVGSVTTDGTSDFELVTSDNKLNDTPAPQTFTADDIWVKPKVGSIAYIQNWAAGGGGDSTSNDAAGGGGGYSEGWFNLSDLGATEIITIGTSAIDSSGGNTTFGSHLTAFGGARGNANVGGGGGGQTGAGSGGIGGAPNGGATGAPGANSFTGGGGGGTGSGQDGGDGFNGGGGGGAGSTSSDGGVSVNGGGGGGGANAGGIGGVSVYGGNGGNSGVAGSAPGGGGGRNAAGGRGEIRIFVY